jgi:uncharacterized lipoprotein NlpE involved in copper resistance
MKKLIASLITVSSLVLVGCGNEAPKYTTIIHTPSVLAFVENSTQDTLLSLKFNHNGALTMSDCEYIEAHNEPIRVDTNNGEGFIIRANQRCKDGHVEARVKYTISRKDQEAIERLNVLVEHGGTIKLKVYPHTFSINIK